MMREISQVTDVVPRMACKLADKAGRVLEQVEVDTSLLIFKVWPAVGWNG